MLGPVHKQDQPDTKPPSHLSANASSSQAAHHDIQNHSASASTTSTLGRAFHLPYDADKRHHKGHRHKYPQETKLASDAWWCASREFSHHSTPPMRRKLPGTSFVHHAPSARARRRKPWQLSRKRIPTTGQVKPRNGSHTQRLRLNKHHSTDRTDCGQQRNTAAAHGDLFSYRTPSSSKRSCPPRRRGSRRAPAASASRPCRRRCRRGRNPTPCAAWGLAGRRSPGWRSGSRRRAAARACRRCRGSRAASRRPAGRWCAAPA